jgi:heat shock protein beta-11
MTEVLFSSSFDDKFQPSNIFSSGKDFWVTTGLYPQELIIQLDSAKSINSINISCYAVKKIVIESCENESAVNFVKQAEMIDIPFNEGKLQEFFLNFSSSSKVKILKVKVEEGYDDFCSIHNINFK